MDEHLFLNCDPGVEAVQIEAQALAAIERDKLDPRQQMYMFNKTTKLLIRSNAQYHRAIENHHQIKIITYAQAEAIYKQEEALKKKALSKVLKRKRAKAARKRNRGI